MKTRILYLIVAATALAASGCAIVPYSPHPYRGEVVMVAPPPPRVEYAGPPPIVGQLWIEGFWNWTGRRHEWVPGHWEAPHHGARWVPRHWDHAGDQWQQSGGYWDEGRR